MNNVSKITYFQNEIAYIEIPEEVFKNHNSVIENSFFGPSHIKWVKNVDFSSPFEYLKQKKRKEFERNFQKISNKIELIESFPLQEKFFLEWIAIYINRINMIENGIQRIDNNWFREQTDPTKIYGLFILDKQTSKIIGGLVGKFHEHKDSIEVSYRAHRTNKLDNLGVSAILEFMIDQFALKTGVSKITRGVDTNLYGFHLSTGLATFKKGYNYTPSALDNLDQKYFPRYLFFLQSSAEIITYIYQKDRTLIENKITSEMLELISKEHILQII